MAHHKPVVHVVCAHFHGDRTVKRDRAFMQPSAGLQIASQIDRSSYDVVLHHEMWHGTMRGEAPRADVVFLTGLQRDFDRQRQLAYLYKRQGAVTVAGGSVCTLFPEFASEFFDVVCAGGVDRVAQVMSDYERGTLRPIYRSSQGRLTDYRVDYDLLGANGVGGRVHLVEASRGCNFKCDFCVIPAEGARHTPLLGTPLFWESVQRGELRPNLRLRDLEGLTIAYRDCLDGDAELTAFADTLFRRTGTLVRRRTLLAKSLRAGWTMRSRSVVPYVLTFGTNLRAVHLGRRRSRLVRRTYLGGTDVLDPQYDSYPSDISPEDRRRYFDPVLITDARSHPAEWLGRYAPQAAIVRPAPSSVPS
jgi:hypothetical protein